MHSLRMEFGVFQMTFIVAALFFVGGASARPETPHSHYRLPTNLKPIHYDLEVITHLEDRFRFEGVVHIKMLCENATDSVVLHSSALDVDARRVKVFAADGKRVPVGSVLVVPTTELMHVYTYGELKAGHEYVLTVPFEGNITDDLVGYYRSSYVDKATNQTRWLAVTQFEPAKARRAFPCFDEPAMKAKFKIRLGHKKHLTSISNMPMVKMTPLPLHQDYVLDEFLESVPMSTYLVAYMVSDFAHVQSDYRHSDVKFKIWARKDAIGQTALAKDVGPSVSRYYEVYFDEKFPLPKQDMVALPDFSAGAMENWGLVTYRETLLLIDPKVATINDIYRVVEVIAHELAHQWFGNLVTMKWWTDLWLNEGFATYVTGRGVDFLYPEWNSFQVTTALNYIRVLDLDSLQSSHPVSVPVGHPNEIAQIFDAISYTKGSYLLYMMNSFLGEEAFKRGVRSYIRKYRYSNAEQDDLWSVMTYEAHNSGSLSKSVTLKEIMDTWTLQTGYPVIKVVWNYSASTVTLSQQRFTRNKSINPDKKSCWWVPLTMTTSLEADFNKTKAKKWLNCQNKEITIPLSSNETWVIFNVQLTGLYRVLYDDRNMLGFVETLNEPDQYKKIHTMNRVQLLEDAFAFALVDRMDYGLLFHMLAYLKHEKEYTPWLAALNGLGYIGKLSKRTQNKKIYEEYMQRLLLPVYNQLRDMTVKPKGFEEIQLKKLIVDSACQNEIKDCTDQALQLYRNWMKTADPDSNNILPKELKSTIYCYAIKHGGEEEWDFLWNRYQRSNVATEKAMILSALGCIKRPLVLKKYLSWTIGENAIIRKQDAISVFHAVSSNDLGFNIAKEFFYRNIKEISEYFHPESVRLGHYIKLIGSQMKTEDDLHEIQTFIKKSSVYLHGTEMAVNQTIETININIEWMSTNHFTIVNFLMHM